MGQEQEERQALKDATPECAREHSGRTVAVCIFLVFAVALVFGQTLGHDFVNFDDGQYVYQNPQVVRGLSVEGVRWAFTHTLGSNWHPLTTISHMLDCQLYGLHPGGHHLTSLLLHAISVILLFLVLLRMTGAFWPSAFIAVVFAIHPLRAESVAWIAERKDVLSGLFFMLTLLTYESYAWRPFSWGRYLAVVVALALGLMSKPMLVTVPLILLLLDFWPLGRMGPSAQAGKAGAKEWRIGRVSIPVRVVVEKLPLFALVAVSCVLTIWAQRDAGAVESLQEIPLHWRIGNALVAYVGYIGKLFYPTGLAVFYPYPATGPPALKVAVDAFLLCGVTLGTWIGRRRVPYLFVGWFWYLIMLVPVIGLVQVGNQAMADRYTYLTQIGLVMAIAFWVARSLRPGLLATRGCGVVAALVIVLLMGCAWRQTSYWKNSETLWRHALASTSNNFFAHYDLGYFLMERGRIDEAIAHYRKALAIKADLVEVQNNLGVALAGKGKIDEAMVHYRKALEFKPDFVDAHNNLGILLASKGKLDEAITHYREALAGNPSLVEARNNLGVALARQGEFDEAILQYQLALELAPNIPDIHNNLGKALAARGRTDEAIGHFRKALERRPDFEEARIHLARLLREPRR